MSLHNREPAQQLLNTYTTSYNFSLHLRSLKELQMEYYVKQNKLADQQLEFYSKMTELAGIMITKFQQ